MGDLQPTHWLLIFMVAVLLFGGPRMAALGQGLGEGLPNFRKGLKDEGGATSGGDATERAARARRP